MTGLKLKCGEWVEVRSKEEILRTLDKHGQLEDLPFMPNMFKFCGKRVRVYKRAHKTCDTVNDYKGRRMKDAVHLEGAWCDGSAHGGCEALCLLFWKEAWLKQVPGPGQGASEATPTDKPATINGAGCAEADVIAGTQAPGSETTDPVYVCQATRLPAATSPLPWWQPGQYVEDLFSGNVGLGKFFRGILYTSYYNLSRAGIGIGPAMRWFYDWFQQLRGGIPYPRHRGTIPVGQKTPGGVLNLQPGEVVRIKPYKEILATLDENNKNRGLYFDAEVVPYCGGNYRVLRRVNKIINEKNGQMLKLNSSVILENVFCQSRYSTDRLFCPRSIYQFMREIWLERVPAQTPAATSAKVPETNS